MSTGEPKYIGVAWSLQFEVVFYVAFCLLLVNARLGAIVFSVWAGVVAGRVLGIVSIQLPFGLGDAHCLQFQAGVIVGVISRKTRVSGSLPMLVTAVAVMAGAIVFEVYGPYGRHAAAGRIVLGLASAIILLTLVAMENGGRVKTPRWLAQLGAVSYSIYLGHVLFVNLTYSILLKFGLYHSLPEPVVYIAAVCVALAATTVIGYIIELPLVDALKSRWNQPTRKKEAAATGT